jgi:uroporphyrinogen-III synthase
MEPAAEPGALTGLRIVTFESRRAEELRRMLERHGADVWSAPALREIALEENEAARELLAELEGGRIDVTILLTGVGTEALAQAVAVRCPPARFAELLGRTRLVARGPKPVAALRRLGLVPEVVAPEPNTWRELVEALDAAVDVRGKRVAVQEYGRTNDALLAALAERGALVRRVPVYRWALPEDCGPLREGIERLGLGRADVAVFTTAVQIDHVMRVAEPSEAERLRRAFRERVVVASIGPTAAEGLASHGVPVDLQPEQPKLGPLVALIARDAAARLAEKRARAGAIPQGIGA